MHFRLGHGFGCLDYISDIRPPLRSSKMTSFQVPAPLLSWTQDKTCPLHKSKGFPKRQFPTNIRFWKLHCFLYWTLCNWTTGYSILKSYRQSWLDSCFSIARSYLTTWSKPDVHRIRKSHLPRRVWDLEIISSIYTMHFSHPRSLYEGGAAHRLTSTGIDWIPVSETESWEDSLGQIRK